MYEYAGTADGYAFAAPYAQEKDAWGHSPARRSRSNGGCMRFVLLLLLSFIIVAILVAATVAILASYFSERDSGKEDAGDVRLDLDHKQPTKDMAFREIEMFARKRSYAHKTGDHESFSRSPAKRRNGVQENRVDGDRPLPESRRKRKQSADADSRAHARGAVVAPSGNGRSEVARRGAHGYSEPHNSEENSRDFVPHQFSDDTVQNSPLQQIDNKLELAPAQSSNAAIENLKSSGQSASPSLLGQGDDKQSQETNPGPENNELKNAAASAQEEEKLNAANE